MTLYPTRWLPLNFLDIKNVSESYRDEILSLEFELDAIEPDIDLRPGEDVVASEFTVFRWEDAAQLLRDYQQLYVTER